MRRNSALVLLALTPVALLVPATPAQAQARGDELVNCFTSCAFSDEREDAPARADILSGRVTNGESAFIVKFNVRKLPKKAKFVVGAGLSGWGENYIVKKTAHGVNVQSVTISEVQVYPAEPCPGAKIGWNRKRDRVKATLPYACGGSADGGSVINGIDFTSGKAKDSAGKVYYTP